MAEVCGKMYRNNKNLYLTDNGCGIMINKYLGEPDMAEMYADAYRP